MKLLKNPSILLCIAIVIAIIGITIWLHLAIKKTTTNIDGILNYLSKENNVKQAKIRDDADLKNDVLKLKKSQNESESKNNHVATCLREIFKEMKKNNPDFSIPAPKDRRKSKKKVRFIESSTEEESSEDSTEESEDEKSKKKKKTKKTKK